MVLHGCLRLFSLAAALLAATYLKSSMVLEIVRWIDLVKVLANPKAEIFRIPRADVKRGPKPVRDHGCTQDC